MPAGKEPVGSKGPLLGGAYADVGDVFIGKCWDINAK